MLDIALDLFKVLRIRMIHLLRALFIFCSELRRRIFGQMGYSDSRNKQRTPSAKIYQCEVNKSYRKALIVPFEIRISIIFTPCSSVMEVMTRVSPAIWTIFPINLFMDLLR